MQSKRYGISGMTCAACAARVEKAARSVPGAQNVSVNLLRNTLVIEGEVSDGDVRTAIEKAGYSLSANTQVPSTDTSLFRLGLCSVLLITLLCFRTPLAQLFLSAQVLALNSRTLRRGFSSLFRFSPNMDALVALGSGIAFAWSLYAYIFLPCEPLYFESAAMIPSIVAIGKALEARAKGKTANALQTLLSLAPQTALVLRDGKETTVPSSELAPGDTFILKPGAKVPADGIVLSGDGTIDESALTGESLPIDKAPGSSVSAATVNLSGHLVCKATRTGSDTSLAQIARIVGDAAATKAPVAKTADKVAAVFVPSVLLLAIITAASWLALGSTTGEAIARAIAVLVISCPCALGLATPVAIMVGCGVGARRGILFKTAASLEAAGRITKVVFDKTGTLTKGTPQVTDIIGSAELLPLATSLETKSEHPFAKAIVRKAQENSVAPQTVENFRALPGNGVRAELNGVEIFGGSLAFVSQKIKVESELSEKCAELSAEGKTPLLFARGETLLGVIAVSDELKADAAQTLCDLRKMKIECAMLTGDNPRTAAAVAKSLHLDDFIAGVLPDGKESAIRQLRRGKPVAMVGDGINDAPALARADLGIAIGAGTDVAIDAADTVLASSRLSDVAAAIRLGRAVLRNIRQNLFWAFGYNALGIPLAAGCFGLKLNPMFGAAAMCLSSLCVVTNALRLNFVKLDGKKTTMQKTISIEGMMCPHCEAHVKQTLEALAGVDSARADHKAKQAVVTLSQDVPDAALKAAVEAQGYKVLSIA